MIIYIEYFYKSLFHIGYFTDYKIIEYVPNYDFHFGFISEILPRKNMFKFTIDVESYLKYNKYSNSNEVHKKLLKIVHKINRKEKLKRILEC